MMPAHGFCYVSIYKPTFGMRLDEVGVDSDMAVGLEQGEIGNTIESECSGDSAAEEENGTNKTDKVVLYYFDCETQFVENAEKNRIELRANLVCIEKETGEAFEFCGPNAADLFMEWLLAEKFDGWRIVYAHNFSGFDSYPVLHFFYERSMLPTPILKGQKCLQLIYKPSRLIFRCSYNFFPFRLTDFTKAFGLNSSKGYFPYLLNKEGNEDYVGKFPDAEYFEPKAMTPKDEVKFLEWWYKKKEKYERMGKQYCLMDKLKKYCRNGKSLEWTTCRHPSA